MPDNCKSLNALRYILRNNLCQGYPNITIALKILLKNLVTGASAERSFSDLMLIKKNCL
jgi:hypothetical protein